MATIVILMAIVITANCQPQHPRCRSYTDCPEGFICTRRGAKLGYCRAVPVRPGPKQGVPAGRTSVSQQKNNLLVGRLISQGANRNEVLGAARSEGVPTGQIETVRGQEIAETGRQHIAPGNELEVG